MTLFDLVASRDLDALKQALAADPTSAVARNGEGASLLAVAAYSGNNDAVAAIRAALPEIDPYEAIIVGDLDRLKALLAGGWDGNARSPDGFPPLALAAFFSRKEMFDLLLPLTKDVNAAATNSQQVAALHAAAAVRAVGAINLLLRAGADPNQPQQHGFVALHTAAMHGDALMAGLLLLFGATPSLRDAGGKSAADHARGAGHEWLAARFENLAEPAPAQAEAPAA